jgi:branched-chain amino acid transport system permease protein
VTREILLLLLQDGVVNGALYALLALALVLVFSVTRVVLIPAGEFVAWGGLTLAALQAGEVPGSVWLLVALSAMAGAADAVSALRARAPRRLAGVLARDALYPAAAVAVAARAPVASWPQAAQIALALALVVPLGPALWRVVYQPLAGAPVLVLLIVSVAAHLALDTLGLVAFGPEGSRTPPLWEARWEVAGVPVAAQSIAVVALSAALVVGLALFSGSTLTGKALRATAMSRTGARLVGIPVALAGRWAFGIAALVAALAGVLVAPITTLYHDTGFLVGLKGFVGAVFGGLASYPAAALGALAVGLVEAGASYGASAYKEVVVFGLVVPALLWRSLRVRHVEDDA